MFNSLLTFLATYCHTTTLLCTATQPTLENRLVPLPIAEENELVPDLEKINTSFERTEIIDCTKDKVWDAEQLARLAKKIMDKENNLLMILNTKKAVKQVYEELKNTSYRLFHLSTAMVPAHRTAVLAEIKDDLTQGKRIICLTTPLIEAGVDISFACVIRSVSGLDSIAQAAGRCNRNGESKSKQPVYLVDPIKELENIDRLKDIKTKKLITLNMLKNRKSTNDSTSLLSPAPLNFFFETYFSEIEKTKESYYLFNNGTQTLFDLMDKNSKRRIFYRNVHGGAMEPTFFVSSSRTIAKHFQVIEQQTKSVLVEFEEGKKLVNQVNGSAEIIFDKKWYQQAQRYSLNLFDHEFKELSNEGTLYLTEAGIYVLAEASYNKEFGLDIKGNSEWSMVSF